MWNNLAAPDVNYDRHSFILFSNIWSHFRIQKHLLTIEGLRERTEYIDIFLFFRPSLNRVVSDVLLLVEGECQILVF